MRENLLEATRGAIDLGRGPTFEELQEDFEAPFIHRIEEQRDPPRIKQFRKIVKSRSFGKVDGTPVDLFSASAVIQVFDSLSKPANKAKYAKMDPVEMISVAYKLVQKGRAKATSRETAQAGASESKVPPQFLSKQGKKKGKSARSQGNSQKQTEASKTYDWLKLGPAKAMASDLKKQISKAGLLNIKVKVKDKGKKYPTTGVLTVDYGSSSMNDIMKLNAILKSVKAKHKGAFTKASETAQAGAGMSNAVAQAVQGKSSAFRPQGNAQVARSQEALSVPQKHQKKIALDTLKMHKAGARIMGGMDHKQAVKFLRSIGYSSSKIKGLLTKAKHDPSDIAKWVSEAAKGKIELMRKASGSQPDVYKVLNQSGGIEGYIEKQPDKRGMKFPYKAFGLEHAPRGRVRGMPGRGKSLGDFPKKDAAIKAVMAAG